MNSLTSFHYRKMKPNIPEITVDDIWADYVIWSLLKPKLLEKQTLEHTSAWKLLLKLQKPSFERNWIFKFGSCPIELHGEGGVYDLYHRQPPADQNVLASFLKVP